MRADLLKLAIVGAIVVCAAGVQAQNWNAFWQAQSISGLTVSYNVGTKELTASMSPGAKVKIAGVEREIQDFFGFFVLTLNGPPDGNTNGPLNATESSGPTGWTFEKDKNWLAGWEDQNKSHLGSPRQGTFATLDFQHVGWWGMHVRYKPGGNNVGGNYVDTQYIRWNGGTPPSNVVPEPFTMGLGIAAAGAFVRRRIKAKNA